MGKGCALGKLKSKTRVLITGGFGYLGGRVAQLLYGSGFRVALGTRYKCSPPEWLPEADVVELIWDDENALVEACCEVDTVIHAAGVNAQHCADNPVAALAFNGVATARLVQASIRCGVSKFIYFSTAHVYCSPLTGVIHERTCPRNLHPYATTHLAGEHALLSAAQGDNDLTGIVLRLSNVIGRPASIDTDCWNLLVNDLCKEVIVKQVTTIRGNPNDFRDFVSMSTLAKVCSCLIENHMSPGSQLHNIGSGQAVTIRQMAEMISERAKIQFGHSPELRVANPTSDVSTRLSYITTPFTCAFLGDEWSALVEEIDNLLQFCKMNFG